MKNIRRLFFTIILALAGFTVFAQKDSVLIKAARLNNHATTLANLYPWGDSATIISNYNDTIVNELPALLADKNILKHNIRNLFSNDIYVTISDDGKLRIFNWFANTGGSWKMYYEIRQYVDGDKIYVSPVEETVGTREIYQFTTSSGIFYMVKSEGITCNSCFVVTVSAFAFNEGELQLCKSCIKGADGTILVDYRSQDLIYFEYDAGNEVLSLAYIVDDLNTGDGEEWGTAVFDAYKFNGNFFERIPQKCDPAKTTEE